MHTVLNMCMKSTRVSEKYKKKVNKNQWAKEKYCDQLKQLNIDKENNKNIELS